MEEFKGLHSFISDIRFCKSREDEENRIEKELAHIREVFVNPKKLEMYDRKKYLLKIMYINILGVSVDFGHMEAMEVIRSPRYQDKIVGYTVFAQLINERSELLRLVNQSLLSDLTSSRDCTKMLALAFIANCGNSETAEILANNVAKILMDRGSSTYLIKKSALCLLHLFRKNPDAVQPSNWNERIITLLTHRDGGVMTSVMSLLNGFATADPAQFENLVPHVCTLVYNVVIKKTISGDYTYDHIPGPWLVVKAFQFLQHYSSIADKDALDLLIEVVQRILSVNINDYVSVDGRSGVVRRHNAMLAVIFEAIFLIVRLNLSPALARKSMEYVRKFIRISDADLRYISLEALQKLGPIDPSNAGEDPSFLSNIEQLLFSPDISLRRRAMDVLFEVCTIKNSKYIIDKLLKYLTDAELELREELVLKIAILAEKYPASVEWYIDVILRLIQTAGDATPQEIWYRTVQIISQHKPMQEYAANSVAAMLRSPSLTETAIVFSAFILGEYITDVKESPGGKPMSIRDIIDRLCYHMRTALPTTKSIVLTALAKIAARIQGGQLIVPDKEQLLKDIVDVLRSFISFTVEDTQERGIEFSELIESHPDSVKEAFQPMPAFEERESILLRDLKRKVKEKGGGIERESRHLAGINDEDEDEDNGEFSLGNVNSGFGSGFDKNMNNTNAGGAGQQRPFENNKETTEEFLRDFKPNNNNNTTTTTTSSSSSSSSTDPDSLLAMLSQGGSSSGQGRSIESNTDLLAVFGLNTDDDTNKAVSLPPPESNPQLEFLYNSLLVTPEGNMYDDLYLTLFCQYRLNKHEQQMIITYINKTSQPLSNLSFSIDPISTDITVQAEPCPQSLSPGQRLMQRILITIVNPFVNSPIATLSYSVGGQKMSFLIKIPTTAFQFFIPLTPPQEMFTQQWLSIPDSSPLEQTEIMLFRKQPFNEQSYSVLCSFLTGPSHMSLLNNYDPTPQTLCFAAGMQCSSSQQNAMPLMVKLKMAPPPPLSPQPGMIILCVKACTDKLAAATRKSVFDTLAEM